MFRGDLGRMALRGGLTLAAALMMTTAVFGQDPEEEPEGPVMYQFDPLVLDGTDPPTDILIDDGTADDGADNGSGDDGVDDGSGDDWVDHGSDDVGTGDGSGDDGVVDDGEVVINDLDGGPRNCDDCEVADLPMEDHQMNAGDPLTDGAAADAPVAAKPRRGKSEAFAAGSLAQCLAEHPQLPWICAWQNGAGQ